MEPFAKGKRSLIYKEDNVIIKIEREDSKAVNRIQNEALWLKKLNNYNIGPKFIKLENNKLYMEYIQGILILDYTKDITKKEKIMLLTDLLNQCRILDTLKVDKLEMHHPIKHVIIRNKKVILIDYERCKFTEKPKNVTQVCQFIARYYHLPEILEIAKKYKEKYSEKEFENLKKCLTNIS